jgi:hypothetical protein
MTPQYNCQTTVNFKHPFRLICKLRFFDIIEMFSEGRNLNGCSNDRNMRGLLRCVRLEGEDKLPGMPGFQKQNVLGSVQRGKVRHGKGISPLWTLSGSSLRNTERIFQSPGAWRQGRETCQSEGMGKGRRYVS